MIKNLLLVSVFLFLIINVSCLPQDQNQITFNYPINYSLIPSVNNSDLLNGLNGDYYYQNIDEVLTEGNNAQTNSLNNLSDLSVLNYNSNANINIEALADDKRPAFFLKNDLGDRAGFYFYGSNNPVVKYQEDLRIHLDNFLNDVKFTGMANTIIEDGDFIVLDKTGLGGNNPQATLHLKDISADVFISQGDSGHSATLGSNTAGEGYLSLYKNATGVGLEDSNILFYSKEGEDNYINNGGDFGIGVSNPLHKLHIKTSNSNIFAIEETAGDYAIQRFISGTSGGDYYFIGYGNNHAKFGTFAIKSNNMIGRIEFHTKIIERLSIDEDGKVMLGIGTPLVTNGGLDISNGGIGLIVGAGNELITRGSTQDKYSRIGQPHYTLAEEPLALILGASTSTVNLVKIGGGTSLLNTATEINFYTAENTITTSGTKQIVINSDGDLNLIKDNQNLVFGASGDSSIYYDEKNLIINPKIIGSGILRLLGNLFVDGYIQGDSIYTTGYGFIGGDLNVSGIVYETSTAKAYAQTDYHNETNPLVIDIVGEDNYTSVTGLHLTHNNSIYMNASIGQAVITKANMYQLSGSISFSGGNSGLYRYNLFVNDLEEHACGGMRSTSSNAHGSLSINCILELNKGDTVNMRVMDTTSPVQDVSIYTLTFNMVEI